MNSIVGLPTIKTWRSILDVKANTLVARGLQTTFPLIYEATKHGLPPNTIFSEGDFIRPIQSSPRTALSLFTNVENKENIK